MLFLPFTLDFQNSVHLVSCFGALRGLRVSEAIKVLKGWCNGWATSQRYHEDKLLPCLFGCSGCSDDLRHYLQCPHLFALWRFFAGEVSEDPLVRWGLISPNYYKLNSIACVFSGYHAIRRDFRARNEFCVYNQNTLSGPQLRAAWSVFADTFLVEASELTVQCSRFSLPSFLANLNRPNFINNHP